MQNSRDTRSFKGCEVDSFLDHSGLASRSGSEFKGNGLFARCSVEAQIAAENLIFGESSTHYCLLERLSQLQREVLVLEKAKDYWMRISNS